MNPIPFVNLRPALASTESDWRPCFEALIERAHFVLGEETAGFESEFAAAMGARFAVGVNSGTDALALSLRAVGLENTGREVLTSALTAPFTALAILAAGCRPRFADVDPDTLLPDVQDAANRVTKATAALLPVHLYGQPCELPAWKRLAAASGVQLLQDACQAHGAFFNGQPLTRWSRCVAYSFYPTKNLGGLGDGGAILTDSPAIARKLRLLRDGGRMRDHVSRIAGVNSRLDELQACFLRSFLKRLSRWNEERRKLVATYNNALRDCAGVRLLAIRPGSVCHLYVIEVEKRARLREYLRTHGIGTAVHYPVPLHLHPAFADCGLRRGDLPQAEKACRKILSLPLWPGLEDRMVMQITDRVREFYRTGSRG
jgi:dTDP-3-amino-3,4,6-trideoxy-alpha-D-glucose transaminase